MSAVRRQGSAFRQHTLTQSQMRDRIRPDQNLKRMEITRPDRRRLRPHPLHRARPARQQECIGQGLRVSVGELGIIRIGPQ